MPRTRLARAFLAASFLAAATSAWAEPQAGPVGRWLTEDGGGVIEIAPCGATLCGRIVGFPGLGAAEATPTDVHGRSQCGLPILESLAPAGANLWKGRVTNPEDGRSYGVEVSLDPAGRLRLRGYVLLPLFGATQLWPPFPGRVGADCRIA